MGNATPGAAKVEAAAGALKAGVATPRLATAHAAAAEVVCFAFGNAIEVVAHGSAVAFRPCGNTCSFAPAVVAISKVPDLGAGEAISKRPDRDTCFGVATTCAAMAAKGGGESVGVAGGKSSPGGRGIEGGV